jgi:hypothetical protein
MKVFLASILVLFFGQMARASIACNVRMWPTINDYTYNFSHPRINQDFVFYEDSVWDYAINYEARTKKTENFGVNCQTLFSNGNTYISCSVGNSKIPDSRYGRFSLLAGTGYAGRVDTIRTLLMASALGSDGQFYSLGCQVRLR